MNDYDQDRLDQYVMPYAKEDVKAVISMWGMDWPRAQFYTINPKTRLHTSYPKERTQTINLDTTRPTQVNAITIGLGHPSYIVLHAPSGGERKVTVTERFALELPGKVEDKLIRGYEADHISSWLVD